MTDAAASAGGDAHESGDQSPQSNVREQDRFLPIANISRIMKKALPANGKIAKDAKEIMQECVSEFISFITSEYVDAFFFSFFCLSLGGCWWSWWFCFVIGCTGRVINARERRGRQLMGMICCGPWQLWGLRIILIRLKYTWLNTERWCVFSYISQFLLEHWFCLLLN